MSSINRGETERLLSKIRTASAIFVLGLVLSGVTAFPLQSELHLISKMRGLDGASIAETSNKFDQWIVTVRDGLHESYGRFPWLPYGTDWLAFAHIAIAIFFIGAFVDPVRNVWIFKAGLVACALVIPTALIAGAFRQIPFGWRLIDCSFGIFGGIPLYYCLKTTRKLDALQGRKWRQSP